MRSVIYSGIYTTNIITRVSLGGTISSVLKNGVIIPKKKDSNHYFYGDSSQMTKLDLQKTVRYLEQMRLSSNRLEILCGTDGAGFLAQRLQQSMTQDNQIVLLSSMTANPSLGAIQLYQDLGWEGLNPGQLRLIVGNSPFDTTLSFNITEQPLYKTGSKMAPFSFIEKKDHLNEITELGYPMVYSNPYFNTKDVINNIKNACNNSNTVVLVGLGDYNFFSHDNVISIISNQIRKGTSFFLTTVFSGSFEEADKFPYVPRKNLETLGIPLLDQAKLRELQKHIK